MYKISEFSRLCQVSTKTLRYYDEIGLLKPAVVEPGSAYRWYSIQQMKRVSQITALKEIGFRLEQIGVMLDEGLSEDAIHGMYRLREAEISHELQDARDRLQRIQHRIRHMEQEGCLPPYEVTVKSVARKKVVALPGSIPNPASQAILWERLHQILIDQHAKTIGPGITLYHNLDYPDGNWDIEVCQEVVGQVQPDESFHLIELPEVEKMACTIHKGDPLNIPQAYRALLTWIDENGYRICSPGRDIGWYTPTDSTQINECLIEAQFPIEEATPAPNP